MTYAVNFETTPRVIAVKLSTGGMMHASFGSVQYVNTGNKKGDVWNIVNADAAHGVNAGDNVAWNGTTWDVLAGTMDLSAYMLAEDLVAISNTELDNICK